MCPVRDLFYQAMNRMDQNEYMAIAVSVKYAGIL